MMAAAVHRGKDAGRPSPFESSPWRTPYELFQKPLGTLVFGAQNGFWDSLLESVSRMA